MITLNDDYRLDDRGSGWILENRIGLDQWRPIFMTVFLDQLKRHLERCGALNDVARDFLDRQPERHPTYREPKGSGGPANTATTISLAGWRKADA